MAPDKEKERLRNKRYKETHREESCAYNKKYRKAHPEKIKEDNKKYRAAHKEEHKKYRAAHKEEAAAYKRTYRATHVEETAAYNRAYQATHKEEKAAYNRTYRVAHLDEEREYGNEWIKNHPEQARATRSGYKKNHPEVVVKHSATRRARISQTLCTLTGEDICTIKSYGCLACDTSTRVTLAHNLPISRGGDTTLDNCFCLCQSCNSKMGTKTLEEWRPDLLEEFKTVYLLPRIPLALQGEDPATQGQQPE